MIGISFLVGLVLWGALAVWISKRIPRWVGIAKHATAVTVLTFPFVFLAPVADELIGRVQFHYLCKREAVVWLSPDWERVTAARENDDPIVKMDGYIIPIRVQRIEFVDVNAGQPFLIYKGFHIKGGFLMRNGLGLGGMTSCWPEDKTRILKKLNIDQLLKQGEMK